MLHRGTPSRIGPPRTLTSPCSMRSGKFVADLRASSGGVRDETPGRGWAGTQRYANISRAPSPLGGLGDNWSNDPPEDEAAQKGKAAAPQRAHGSSPISDKKKIELLTRELSEALEHQTATSRELSESLERETATSQVLGIISSSLFLRWQLSSH